MANKPKPRRSRAMLHLPIGTNNTKEEEEPKVKYRVKGTPSPSTPVGPGLPPTTPSTASRMWMRSIAGVPPSFFEILKTVPKPIQVPQAPPTTPRLTKSFGMDLTHPENIEKLCDHYFKLGKKLTKEEFHKKLSVLLQDEGIPPPASPRRSKSTPNPKDGGRDPKFISPEDKEGLHKFGDAYHGSLKGSEVSSILKEEGQYLVRRVKNEASFILSFRCNGGIHNFRVYKTLTGQYHLEDKKKLYPSIGEMVNDGLTTLFLDSKVGSFFESLNELAHINKHDSIIFGLTPSPTPPISLDNNNKGPMFPVGSSMLEYRKSAVMMTPTPAMINEEDEVSTLPELSQHWLIPGTIPLDKKTPCDLESCPLRTKKVGKSPQMPSEKQTLQCKDCGLTIHEKCQDLLPLSILYKCTPDLYILPEIFGTDLTTLVKSTKKKDDKDKWKPPFVVVKCIEEIEQRGIKYEGIYRIPGSQDEVFQVKDLLERDRMGADLSQVSDTNSICGTLKLYLRMLPEPLITRKVFSGFMQDFESDVPLSLESIKKNLSSLPEGHKITLHYLMGHLSRVAAQKESNRMTAYNLASVFPPSIMSPEEMTFVTLKVATDVLELMIKNYKDFKFFEVEE